MSKGNTPNNKQKETDMTTHEQSRKELLADARRAGMGIYQVKGAVQISSDLGVWVSWRADYEFADGRLSVMIDDSNVQYKTITEIRELLSLDGGTEKKAKEIVALKAFSDIAFLLGCLDPFVERSTHDMHVMFRKVRKVCEVLTAASVSETEVVLVGGVVAAVVDVEAHYRKYGNLDGWALKLVPKQSLLLGRMASLHEELYFMVCGQRLVPEGGGE